MKNIIIYFLAMLFCLAACKKTEETARVRFAQIQFAAATKYRQTPYVLYYGKQYTGGVAIASEYGDRRYQVYKPSGEKVLDTVVNVSGPQLYYIYQPDSTTVPVLLTELPPPPPPPPAPDNPLDGSTAAPQGYVQLRVRNNAKEVLPFEKLDLVLRAVTGYDPVISRDITVPLDTISLKGFDYNTDFFLFKRQADYGYFKFSFIDPGTGKEINDASGYLYVDVYGFNFNKQLLNNYAIEIDYYETTDPEESKTAILRNGKYYMVYADLKFQK